MKILFINNYFYRRGGAETIMFDQMDLMKDHGHDVAVFTRHHEKNADSDWADYFAPPFEYENIPLRKKFKAALKLIYSYETRRCLSRLLNDFKPDLIYCHNIYGRLTSSVIDAARQAGVPLIMALHDYKMICPSYLMFNRGMRCEKCGRGRFYQCLLNKCHKEKFIPSLIYTIETYFNVIFNKYAWSKYLICPSSFLLKKHLEAGIPEKKLVHINHFVNVKRYLPEYARGEYILFVGRISKEKGILTLIKAVQGLYIPLKIAGDGPMIGEYREYVRRNNIHNVHFEGHKSDTGLADLYKKAAFAVVPSEWNEVFGLIIIESFACGKPVIASRTGGIPELVSDNETGFLFRAGDHLELREKIAYLYSQPALIGKMGKNARKKVEEEYSSGVHYRKLMETYEKVIR